MIGFSVGGMLSTASQANNDVAFELRQAQTLLAAGQYSKAYSQYQLFAEEKGNPLAQFTIAMFHQLGWGEIPVDSATACAWHEKAAMADIPASAHFHAECFERGSGRTVDYEQAAIWYEKAAQLGHHMSLCSLADLYMKGQGVEKNPQKGLALCLQSVEMGATPAEVKVGRYLFEGDKSIRDPAAAYTWFERAAVKSPEAQYYLGLMHREGIAIEKHVDDARYWFETAAGQGYVPAYFPTADSYFHMSPDYEKSRPSAEVLAKTYMWLSATVKQSKDPIEIKKSQTMLDQVATIMPGTWIPTLDQRVEEHIAKRTARH